MYFKKLVYILLIPATIVTAFLINWCIFSEAPILFQYSLPSSIPIAFTIILQIGIRLRNMPRLEITYNARERNELYHHRDVPLNTEVLVGISTIAARGNYALVGVKNAGNGIAKNCRAKLSIFLDNHFELFFDNPFGLYFSHDPESRNGSLPSLFDLPSRDEEFLSICYIRNDGKLFFDDRGQFTNRREQKLSRLPRGTKCFYVKVTVYSENAATTQNCFRIKTTGIYPNLTMTKIEPPKGQEKRHHSHMRT